MSSEQIRNFNKEMNILLAKRVKVTLENGKEYNGILRGIDQNFTVCLADAVSDKKMYHRVFLNGKYIVELTLAEKPFDLRGLAQELERMFKPENVKLHEDVGVIKILDRFKVSEDGVEGEGPVAERIRRVWEKYKKTE